MRKISRHQWIKAKKEYFRLNQLTDLSSEEKKLLEKYKNLYFNYETIDELDPESKIDRLVVASPLTILIPIYGILNNWDLGTNSLVLDLLTIFFFTLLFIIFTNLFQWLSFISFLIFLPWILFYLFWSSLIAEFAIKFIKDDILDKIIDFGSSYRVCFHNLIIGYKFPPYAD